MNHPTFMENPHYSLAADKCASSLDSFHLLD